MRSMTMMLMRPRIQLPATNSIYPAWRQSASPLYQLRRAISSKPTPSSAKSSSSSSSNRPEKREFIYTLPNALTMSRILVTPVIGYYVLQGELGIATSLLFVAGVTDLLDGWIARTYNMRTVLGSILDPAADKFLMTTMVVTLTMEGMLPLPLAVLILGRDAALSLSAFYFRYISLPAPKTFKRYWDFAIPSAEVKPTEISKYNTALQLLLVGATTISPIVPYDLVAPLMYLQWTVAGTTVWSGMSYLLTKNGVKYIK